MAITQMAKVMIVAHRSQASDLLEALQAHGICQILNADEAMVSKNFPDLAAPTDRPKDIEQTLNRLSRSLKFLTPYAKPNKGLAAVLAPRAVIDEKSYDQVVSDNQITSIIERAEQTQAAVEKLKAECEALEAALEMLAPWVALRTPVEEFGRLHKATCLTGLIPVTQFDKITVQLAELGAALQQIATSGNKHACLIFCLNDSVADVQKALRSAEFEPVAFESMAGTVTDLISERRQKLNETKSQLQQHYDEAASLSRNLLKLQVLHDHHSNLLAREQTRGTAPATEQTVILEGWVKEKDFGRLEKTVSRFKASSLSRIDPAEDEQIPVEIENKNYIRPFEVITRLYGMPQHFEVDPTALLAPFFALFFALCLTDAGYGLIMIAVVAYFIRKMQGDKKLMWMLGICSVVTVVAGAVTGGWFGDAVQQFCPALKPLRQKMIWFDPFEKPEMFFALSVVLGYVQIIFGILVAFIHNLRTRQYVAAVCDQFTWLIMLNAIVLFIAAKAGVVNAQIGGFCGKLALLPAAVIVLYSERQGSWGARLGMGLYNLFSAVFYLGDVLSYLRLMALGMVTAGLAMAINVIAKIVLKLPYGAGIILALLLVLVPFHLFNMALSALGAFVHTLRLQYAEFFPKFFVGGGRLFQPLSRKYEHVYVKESETTF
ncbi:MAG: V-type ATP synthase subunit I [Planctomycetota bacterium]|jgi:V/A-type H+-transporting ATPase subunit I